jgi:hypothetical protein
MGEDVAKGLPRRVKVQKTCTMVQMIRVQGAVQGARPPTVALWLGSTYRYLLKAQLHSRLAA